MLHAFEGTGERGAEKGRLALYTLCAKACTRYGGMLFTPDQKGALIWLDGPCFPLGLWRELQTGMVALPFLAGVKPIWRLVQHDAVPEGWIRKNAGTRMGYIWCLGVLEEARGQGHSRQLIEQAIADMKQRGLTEFWLKTEDPKNVLIYQKIGFETKYETVVPSSGIHTFAMKYVKQC